MHGAGHECIQYNPRWVETETSHKEGFRKKLANSQQLFELQAGTGVCIKEGLNHNKGSATIKAQWYGQKQLQPSA